MSCVAMDVGGFLRENWELLTICPESTKERNRVRLFNSGWKIRAAFLDVPEARSAFFLGGGGVQSML